MRIRAGFDLKELMYIAEAIAGQTPTSGTWNHILDGIAYRPRPQIIARIRHRGLGSQSIVSQLATKRHAEAELEHILIQKSATPSYDWIDFFKFVLGSSLMLELEDTLASFSLGAKLDLPTPEYILLKGCKIDEYSISSRVGELVVGRVSIRALDGSYGTQDYVSGTATRAPKPPIVPMSFEDLGILYDNGQGFASIKERVAEFIFTISRGLRHLGTSPNDPRLYREIAEGERSLSVEMAIEFQDTQEYLDMLGDVGMRLELRIPDAVGGLRLRLEGGRWTDADLGIVEVEPIVVRMRADFTHATLSLL